MVPRIPEESEVGGSRRDSESESDQDQNNHAGPSSSSTRTSVRYPLVIEHVPGAINVHKQMKRKKRSVQNSTFRPIFSLSLPLTNYTKQCCVSYRHSLGGPRGLRRGGTGWNFAGRPMFFHVAPGSLGMMQRHHEEEALLSNQQQSHVSIDLGSSDREASTSSAAQSTQPQQGQAQGQRGRHTPDMLSNSQIV